MIFVNAETNSKIHIGRAGEHKTTTVVFDISDWIEEVRNEIDPNLGTIELIVEQNSMSYPQLVEYNREEKKVYWVVTHSNTSEPGIGKCELFYLGKEELTRLFKKPDSWETEYTEYYDAEGNQLVEGAPHEWNNEWKSYSDDIPYFYMARPTLKTALYEIIVTNALGYNEEEPPGPYESWVDNVLNASTDIKQAGDEAIIARDEVIVARNETVAAKNEAIAARDEAVEAQRGANAAIGEVINAKNEAVSAKNKAVEAQELAVNAKNEAETIKNAVIEARNTAETAAQEALERKNEAVSAKNEAIKAQGLAEKAQGAAEGAQSAAEAAQSKAEGAQGLAERARDEAKQYIGNPPIPDENTKTWWVYDPEDLTANENGYVNTNMPYNFHIDYIVQNQTELAAITGMKTGDMAAIQAAVSDPMNAQLYIYTGNGSTNGWEFLLDLSGATGNGIASISKTSSTINEQGNIVDTYTITYTLSDPTTFTIVNGKDGADGVGSGDMLKKDYDPGEVVKMAGGIVKYVDSKIKEGGTGIVWKKWISTDII